MTNRISRMHAMYPASTAATRPARPINFKLPDRSATAFTHGFDFDRFNQEDYNEYLKEMLKKRNTSTAFSKSVNITGPEEPPQSTKKILKNIEEILERQKGGDEDLINAVNDERRNRNIFYSGTPSAVDSPVAGSSRDPPRGPVAGSSQDPPRQEEPEMFDIYTDKEKSKKKVSIRKTKAKSKAKSKKIKEEEEGKEEEDVTLSDVPTSVGLMTFKKTGLRKMDYAGYLIDLDYFIDKKIITRNDLTNFKVSLLREQIYIRNPNAFDNYLNFIINKKEEEKKRKLSVKQLDRLKSKNYTNEELLDIAKKMKENKEWSNNVEKSLLTDRLKEFQKIEGKT